jgi:coenzyme F420 biosynthesis associated uncharacterized protein
MAQLVDWDLATATARTLGKGGPEITLTEAHDVVADLRRLTDDAAGHVIEFSKMTPQVGYHAVRVVDRGDWAAVNLAGLREVITPLAARLTGGNEPTGLAAMVGPRITGVQAGTVLAYLSGRVLGQYEVFSSDPGELLLVAPNIVEVERKIEAVPRDFRLWVCLHEVTHRTQFTAVPWMRGHFLEQVHAFADAAGTSEQFVERLRRGVSALAESVRNPDSRSSVLDLVQTPAQKAIVDRLTGLMTLVEGHAEFVMDGVGPEVVPTVTEIRARFNERRAGRQNPIERVVRRLLGVDLKMRQYAEGHKFVAAVVERVGIDGFNRIWTSPDTLPTMAEIADPDTWVARVHG